jgi:hypothetical protein
MPGVLCGLKCFDVPVAATAGDVAQEFSASLNPALNRISCPMEVYRLEPVAPDVQLSVEDLVVCSIPDWQFDFAALEDLHQQFDKLQWEHENLLVQYSRTNEILVSLDASMETAETVEVKSQYSRTNEILVSLDASMETADTVEVVEVTGSVTNQRRGAGGDSTRGHRKEVEHLKMQLSQSEKRQQETKSTVMALRTEFMQLVDTMAASAGLQYSGGIELPMVMKELENSWLQTVQSPQLSPCEAERSITGVAGGVWTADGGKARHCSQPPSTTPSTWRGPAGSPRVHRALGTYTTPRPSRPAERQRGVHQRGGHSAVTSMRQR